MRRRVTVLIVALLAAGAPARAADPDHEAELERARAELARLGREVERRGAAQDAARDALARADRALTRATRTLDAARRERDAADAALAVLEKQVAASQRNLGAERRALARTLRVVWQTRHESRLKLLLSGGDPADLARRMVYQRHLAQAGAARVETLAGALADLADQRAALAEQRTRAEALRARHAAATADLAEAHAARAEALAEAGQALDSARARERRAQADAARLSALIAGISARQKPAAPLARALAPPDFSGVLGTFRSQRGRLPWPVPGRVAARFGQMRASGQTRWQGTLIATAPGTPVRAVHAGKVVYADALRGFGLLVIVDHGGGYLSLYGYNAALHRAAGEEVKPGDVLAEVGAGLVDPDGLYFEIRAAGKPVNPGDWCRG